MDSKILSLIAVIVSVPFLYIFVNGIHSFIMSYILEYEISDTEIIIRLFNAVVHRIEIRNIEEISKMTRLEALNKMSVPIKNFSNRTNSKYIVAIEFEDASLGSVSLSPKDPEQFIQLVMSNSGFRKRRSGFRKRRF